MTSRSDAELVRRVLNGDRNSYGDLVDRHQDALYRHTRGMGLDHDTSLDVIQDAFVKAYARIDECRDPAHFRSWIFRITRNLCLDHLKSVRRLTIPMSQVDGVEDISSSEDASEVDQTLREALQHLPPLLREAFLLKHDAGYTYDEVAELTSASPSAVKMRVHRARESLRDFLIEQGVHAA